ncbi:hypothetical protein [Flavobacterium kingsejongi]|uniref:UspA domain-containing protein n=1 Tax=Flavobacterium kingsejongi TaxID=1678728 RepID=A0A2S1LJR0_9FLAO|nr:hypothetical protein [Flavobacterium kingsejongi]AWG23972.1 hypothetical protein FK004_01410 [Flavobacterium kingsejongi]
MKNILIPTQLQQDTISAVKTAAGYSGGKKCDIILLLVSEVPESYSSAYMLRKMKHELAPSQAKVLQNCRSIAAEFKNCTLKVHNQYGISAPLLRNLTEHFSIGLTILAPSYKTSQNKMHSYLLQLLLNSKCPILHLGTSETYQDFNKALYLEHTSSRIQVEDLQSLVKEQFSFRIVSQAKVHNELSAEALNPMLTEAISKNNIDILIETRKPEKIKLRRKEGNTSHLSLGLPVLSLYEEAI